MQLENINVCKLGKYINNVVGLSSNSSSPSDTWITTFDKDTKYYDENVGKAFMKIL